jgi:hypothetical protein
MPGMDTNQHYHATSDALQLDKLTADDGSNSPKQTAHSLSQSLGGSRTSVDLLRRMSLLHQRQPSVSGHDLQEAYTSLKLSGNVISVAICIPYSLSLRTDGDWVSMVTLQDPVY